MEALQQANQDDNGFMSMFNTPPTLDSLQQQDPIYQFDSTLESNRFLSQQQQQQQLNLNASQMYVNF